MSAKKLANAEKPGSPTAKNRTGGRRANNKGKVGEREVIALLQPVVTAMYESARIHPDNIPRLQRNKQQSYGGGYDLIGLDDLAIEVKNQKTLKVEDWWAQTLRQCGKSKAPILLYKVNGHWRARLFVIVSYGQRWKHVAGDIDWGAFMTWFEFYLINRVKLFIDTAPYD